MGISIGPRMVARGNGVEAAVFAPPFRLLGNQMRKALLSAQGTQTALVVKDRIFLCISRPKMTSAFH